MDRGEGGGARFLGRSARGQVIEQGELGGGSEGEQQQETKPKKRHWLYGDRWNQE